MARESDFAFQKPVTDIDATPSAAEYAASVTGKGGGLGLGLGEQNRTPSIRDMERVKGIMEKNPRMMGE